MTVDTFPLLMSPIHIIFVCFIFPAISTDFVIEVQIKKLRIFFKLNILNILCSVSIAVTLFLQL